MPRLKKIMPDGYEPEQCPECGHWTTGKDGDIINNCFGERCGKWVCNNCLAYFYEQLPNKKKGDWNDFMLCKECLFKLFQNTEHVVRKIDKN